MIDVEFKKFIDFLTDDHEQIKLLLFDNVLSEAQQKINNQIKDAVLRLNGDVYLIGTCGNLLEFKGKNSNRRFMVEAPKIILAKSND